MKVHYVMGGGKGEGEGRKEKRNLPKEKKPSKSNNQYPAVTDS